MLKEIDVQEFVRRLKKSAVDSPTARFAIFLGAGCSVSSGIPTASELVDRWLPRLKEIRTGNQIGWEAWASTAYPGYIPQKSASLYKKIIEDLFLTQQDRQLEIAGLTEGRDPGFGYSVLSQLISHPDYGRHFNTVLTTNFDDLVADALYLFSHQKPLVISHQALAVFVRSNQARPLIVKLHGDAILEPKNTTSETTELSHEIKGAMTAILRESGLIFVGYGGNDTSIQNMLDAIPTQAFPFGIFWVNENLPGNELKQWLEERKAIWVKNFNFDELMLLIRQEFGFQHPDFTRFENMEKNLINRFTELVAGLEKRPVNEERGLLEEAAKDVAKDFPNWVEVVLETKKYADTDPLLAKTIFENGVKKYPEDASLYNDYGVFLLEKIKDIDGAGDKFLKAIELNPNSASSLGNYAAFLFQFKHDVTGAESFYQRALKIRPNHAGNLANYAKLLWLGKGDFEKAKGYFRGSLTINPADAVVLNNFAVFQSKALKDLALAETLFKQALSIAPMNPDILNNYGRFNWTEKNDVQQARYLFEQALAIDPNHSDTLANLALFKWHVDANYDEAESHFRHGLDVDEKHVNNLGNFANFLWQVRNNNERADELFKLALAIDNSHSNNLGNYATFLWTEKNEIDKAEELYTKAEIEGRLLKENSFPAILNNFGNFKWQVRKDKAGAEKLYRQGLELEPDNAFLLSNLGGLLLSSGEIEEGLPIVKKALQNNPDKNTLLEIHFYLYAFAENVEDRVQSFNEVKKLVGQGAFSKDWDFLDIVDTAVKAGHPNGNTLLKLAEIIALKTSAETIDTLSP